MIHFQKLRWQNLLSTGNDWTEIQLDRSKATLVVGENGAGKSTMLDALSFVLFGRPFRNINKPQLVNSITNKHLLVEVEFKIAGKQYLIRRGIKPNVFEVYQNERLLDQDAGTRDYQEMVEKQILKMNMKSFSQIVVLGSANFVPFMQLPTNHRKEVIEDLLDIEIFTTMYIILRERISQNRSALVDIDHEIELTNKEISVHKEHLEIARQDSEKAIKTKQKKLAQLAEHKTELEAKVAKLETDRDQLFEKISSADKITDAIKKVEGKTSQIKHSCSAAESDIIFFDNHDNCPTCKQEIDPEFKNSVRDDKKNKIESAKEMLQKLDEKYSELKSKWDKVTDIQEDISNINTNISTTKVSVNGITNNIKDVEAEIIDLENKSNKGATKDKLVVLREHHKDLTDERKQLVHKRELLEVAQRVLKDSGIKTKIIRQYIPIINKLINKYLAAMDFFVQFELDESFNETIKSRFRDEFSYASFSEGEKMRIDLSLLFAWRAVAKLRNSATTNLLIMDEVFDSSLDSTGTDEFMKILEQLTQDTNMFVISHKGDQLYDKFESIIRFEKNGNFSRIAK